MKIKHGLMSLPKWLVDEDESGCAVCEASVEAAKWYCYNCATGKTLKDFYIDHPSDAETTVQGEWMSYLESLEKEIDKDMEEEWESYSMQDGILLQELLEIQVNIEKGGINREEMD